MIQVSMVLFHTSRYRSFMNDTQMTAVEASNRIQLPADWATALGLHHVVRLDRTSQGILIRPWPATTWHESFATKLTIGSAPPSEDEEELELTGDDLLF
jgi:hypothetical protein